MIDCSTISTKCSVSANEQAICSLIWASKWILIPILILLLIYMIYKKYKRKK
jgi:uncharacterized membrane protein YqhA